MNNIFNLTFLVFFHDSFGLDYFIDDFIKHSTLLYWPAFSVVLIIYGFYFAFTHQLQSVFNTIQIPLQVACFYVAALFFSEKCCYTFFFRLDYRYAY